MEQQQKTRRKKSFLSRADHFSEDAHRYRINRSTARIKYMKCSTKFCHGTAKMIVNPDGTYDWKCNDNHDTHCYTSKKQLECAKFRDAIQDSLSRHYDKLKDVYNTYATLYPKAAEQVPYATLLPSMKLWRKATYPKNPKNIDELGEQIEAMKDTKIFEGVKSKLQSYEVIDEDGFRHMLFYDKKLIDEQFQDVEQLLADATYYTTPKMEQENNLQLFSVMGIKYGHAMTFMYCLMTRKTQKAYKAVLSHFKTLIPSEKIKIVMTDFETALRNEMEKAFPNARCVGCNVHFDRAIYSKIKSLNLVDYLKNNPEAKSFVKKITVLAFLPAEKIRGAFATLCDRTDKKIIQKLKDFLKYFQNFWLNCVKPENFSIFGLLVRTNNAIEASHSQLRYKIGKHPQVWDFICKLRLLIDTVWFDTSRLQNRKRVSRQPRYQTVYRQTEILRVWKKYMMNEISAQEVLDMMASLKGHLCERIRRTEEVNIDDFQSGERQFNTLDPDFDERVLHILTQAGALALPRDNLENPNHAVIDELFDAPADADEEALSDAGDIENVDNFDAFNADQNESRNEVKENVHVQNENQFENRFDDNSQENVNLDGENIPHFYKNPLREANTNMSIGRKRLNDNRNKKTEHKRKKIIMSNVNFDIASTVELPQYVKQNIEKAVQKVMDNVDSTYKILEERPSGNLLTPSEPIQTASATIRSYTSKPIETALCTTPLERTSTPIMFSNDGDDGDDDSLHALSWTTMPPEFSVEDVKELRNRNNSMHRFLLGVSVSPIDTSFCDDEGQNNDVNDVSTEEPPSPIAMTMPMTNNGDHENEENCNKSSCNNASQASSVKRRRSRKKKHAKINKQSEKERKKRRKQRKKQNKDSTMDAASK